MTEQHARQLAGVLLNDPVAPEARVLSVFFASRLCDRSLPVFVIVAITALRWLGLPASDDSVAAVARLLMQLAGGDELTRETAGTEIQRMRAEGEQKGGG